MVLKLKISSSISDAKKIQYVSIGLPRNSHVRHTLENFEFTDYTVEEIKDFFSIDLKALIVSWEESIVNEKNRKSKEHMANLGQTDQGHIERNM